MKLRWLLPVLAVIALLWFLRRDSHPRLDAPAVVAQVQRLNQLATVRYTVQRVIDLEQASQPVGRERILLILQANVTAGVDLAGLRPRDVSLEPNGGITIRLPRAQVLNVAVDERATRVWDRQKTWWTPWIPFSKDLEQRARLQGLDASRQAALQMGILDQAQRNAEDSIRALLSLAGVRSVMLIPGNAS